MTKYFSIYEGKIGYIIPLQIWHKAYNFLVIPKAKATILLTEQMLEQI